MAKIFKQWDADAGFEGMSAEEAAFVIGDAMAKEMDTQGATRPLDLAFLEYALRTGRPASRPRRSSKVFCTLRTA